MLLGIMVCRQVIDALRGRVQFIFIENICNDPDILRQNYFNKMLYSPDYKGVPTEQVREPAALLR